MAKRAVGLRKARELLSNPERWGQEHYARTREGKSVLCQDPEAYTFCAVGACIRVRADTGPLRDAVSLLKNDRTAVVEYNDASERTHDEVLWLFDLAIALAEVGGW